MCWRATADGARGPAAAAGGSRVSRQQKWQTAAATAGSAGSRSVSSSGVCLVQPAVCKFYVHLL